MRIAVLVEPMPGNGFRARGAEPFGVCVEGVTRDEAVAKLKDEVKARLRAGGEIVTVEVGSEPHPLAKYAGTLPDDELTAEWEAAMVEYRRQAECLIAQATSRDPSRTSM